MSIKFGPGDKDPNSLQEVERRQRAVKAIIEDAGGVKALPLTTLTDGSPVTEDHREINLATGMQRGYVVLSEEERAKGYVRPLRYSYVHTKCGVTTKMGFTIAETYACDPKFYGGTFCAGCREHFPLDEFVWEGTNEKVGS